MVSSIEQKKIQKKKVTSSKHKSSSNVGAFFTTLVNWIIGIAIAVIMYVSFSTGYFTYGNDEMLPSNPKEYPYAKQSLKSKLQQTKDKGIELGKALGHKVLSKINTKLDSKISQTGGVKKQLPYFYRKTGKNPLWDGLVDILIYSWSSLRGTFRDVLPDSNPAKLQTASFLTKLGIFLLAPIAVLFGSKIVMFIGFLRTLWGVYAIALENTSTPIFSFLLTFIIIMLTGIISIPTLLIISSIVALLQAGWFFYTFGISGFMNSPKGTFKETAKHFTNIITILLAVGFLSASSHLSDGGALGVKIVAGILALYGVFDLVKKMSNDK